MEHDVVIIGGGASGLTAAQMLAGESLRVALVSEGSLAGDLPNLEWLNDFPRDGHRVQGSEFAARLIDDAQAAGVRFIEGRVQELESYSSSHAAVLTNGRALTATFMVLAPGRVASRGNPATRSRHIPTTWRGAEGHLEAPI